MSEVNRGSQWRKWDLHLHTASSYDYKYKAPDADEILVSKLRENKIEGVAITDHFLIDKERICNLRKLAPEITFFPGVELRTDKGDTNIHVILIFSDIMDLDNLCNDFDYFKRNEAKAVEKEETIYWDYDDIVEFAKERGGIISIHAGSKTSGIDKQITNALEHNQAVKVEYSNTVDIFELGKINDADGYKKYVFPAIGKRKPLIISSDNHDPKDYDNSKCLWIKSDLTFEGLKQIIYEPEERIRYGETHPDTKSDYMVIDYVEYNEGKRIYFNRGLNAIIGGRSTGKSTLLNSIAKYQNNKNFGEDDRRYTLQFDYKEFKVVWADGKEDTQRPVEFIPQEFMISISDNRNKLNELLGEIISKKNMDSEERQYREKVQDIDRDIRLFLDDYMKFANDKKQLIRPEGDKEEETKIVKDLEERYQKILLENKFSDDENEEYKNICVEKEKLEKDLNNLNKEKDKLKKIRDLDFYVYVDLEDISIDNKSLIENTLEEIRQSSKEKWQVFIKELLKKVEETNSKKSNKHKEIISSEIFKKGEVLKENNEHIKGLEKQLATHKNNILGIERYEKQLLDIEKKLEDLSQKIIEKFVEYFKAIEELKQNFKLEENELKIEIKTIVPNFDDKVEYLNSKKSVNRDFIEKFNNSIKNILEEESKAFLKSIFKDDKLVFNKTKNKYDLIKDIFETNWYKFDYLITYQNDEFQEMSQGKKSFVILKLLLEFSDDKKPVFIDQPEDSLDNRAIYNELRKYLLDTKKNRQVIVVTHNPNVVVGADAENVIVANQHSNIEKNEDEMKFQYVNGSLENTRAYNKNCEYILCSQGIREHIFDVLEGGKEAFAKREQKYNYKEINNKHES